MHFLCVYPPNQLSADISSPMAIIASYHNPQPTNKLPLALNHTPSRQITPNFPFRVEYVHYCTLNHLDLFTSIMLHRAKKKKRSQTGRKVVEIKR